MIELVGYVPSYITFSYFRWQICHKYNEVGIV